MTLIVTGHQRSGTTLLARLLNAHPEVELTGEFGNFMRLGESRRLYISRMLKRWGGIAVRGWRRNVVIQSNQFILDYLRRIMRYGADGVTVEIIDKTLHELIPGPKLVGDKYPEYIWDLENLAAMPDLSTLVVYRDCRDVTSSTLVRARGAWRRMPLFVRKIDTAEKVARRWVRAVELMETHRADIFSMSYEELVTEKRAPMDRLAEWLEIDPAGFDLQQITDRSIGKYQHGLTPFELDTVMRIAGPTMSRLGYC